MSEGSSFNWTATVQFVLSVGGALILGAVSFIGALLVAGLGFSGALLIPSALNRFYAGEDSSRQPHTYSTDKVRVNLTTIYRSAQQGIRAIAPPAFPSLLKRGIPCGRFYGNDQLFNCLYPAPG